MKYDGYSFRAVCDDLKSSLSMTEVAEYYGFHPTRGGFIRCPFHDDKSPSLKLYGPGRGWFCYGCGAGGSAIDFTARYFGLSTFEAVKKLNDDFHLGYDLEPHEQTEAELAAARERKEVDELRATLEEWRTETIDLLNQCLQIAASATRPPEKWTPAQLEAKLNEPQLEYDLDLLQFGASEDILDVFDARKELEAKCRDILKKQH